jgi:V/A-type H+-transporting ATPase subunit E
MQDKLQELTEKLYNEGLSKGKAEGEQLVEEAYKESERILSEARKQAAEIKAKAEKDAEDLQAKVASDLKMSSAQVLQATKKDIENLLLGRLTDVKALGDPAFLKEIIKAVASRFDAQEPQPLQLILPEKLCSDLEPWVAGELSKILKKGVSAQFTKKSAGGFSIGPKDGGWFISLTEESFKALMAEYLRPVTNNILFGE